MRLVVLHAYTAYYWQHTDLSFIFPASSSTTMTMICTWKVILYVCRRWEHLSESIVLLSFIFRTCRDNQLPVWSCSSKLFKVPYLFLLHHHHSLHSIFSILSLEENRNKLNGAIWPRNPHLHISTPSWFSFLYLTLSTPPCIMSLCCIWIIFLVSSVSARSDKRDSTSPL